MNHKQRLSAAFLLAFLAGCVTPQRPGPTSRPTPTPSEADLRAELRARAEQLWKARLNEDWVTTYLFESDETQKAQEVTAYAAGKEQTEPFVTKAYTIKDAAVQDGLGWVLVDATLAMRKFQNVPPRQVTRWEKWYREQDRWRPVPSDQLDAYPEAPAERDLAQEPLLAARSDELWQARKSRDWSRMFQLIAPKDRAELTEKMVAEEENKSTYLSRRVHWVEVRGESGQVRVTVEAKMNDPSATKLPAGVMTVNEHWVKVQGEWYLGYASKTR